MYKSLIKQSSIMLTLLLLGTLSIASVASTGQQVTAVIDDTRITTEIMSKYALAPGLSPLDVSVSTDQGVVVLKGTVDTDQQYEQAITIAESVDGVQHVDADELDVKGSEQPFKDSYITSKVKAALLKAKVFGDTDIDYWDVHVETKNGVVYLTGKVDNNDQKHNVELITRSVAGVESVDDSGLRVE